MSHHPDYRRPVRLSLGPRVYELTTRALGVAVLDGSGAVTDQAAQAIEDGVDVVEVATIDDVVAVHARFDCAISFVCRDRACDVTAAIRAGASLIDDRRGFLDADLIAAAKKTAAVVLTVAACAAPLDACDHLAAAAG